MNGQSSDSESIEAKEFIAFILSIEIFSEILRLYLEQKKISQRKLSHLMNVTEPAIHHWITGARFPDFGTTYLIAFHLHLNRLEMDALFDAWLITDRAKNIAVFCKAAYQCGDFKSINVLKNQFLSSHRNNSLQIGG